MISIINITSLLSSSSPPPLQEEGAGLSPMHRAGDRDWDGDRVFR